MATVWKLSRKIISKIQGMLESVQRLRSGIGSGSKVAAAQSEGRQGGSGKLFLNSKNRFFDDNESVSTD